MKDETKKTRESIAKIVTSLPFVYRLYLYFVNRDKNKNFSLKYKIEDLNKDYYDKIKNINERELEHQIGRLTNFKAIVKECLELKGDFIEFGSWRGFSLLWIAYLMERNAIFHRKLIGLDGFVGLPYADKVFRKNDFCDTSLKTCWKNIYGSDLLYPETKKNILIAQYLYKEKNAILKYLSENSLNKFCFIHIDCDVSQSFVEIWNILLDGDLIADTAFVLFDDYGCDSDLKRTVDHYFKKIEDRWSIKEHSATNLTKNFIFIKK